MRDKKIRILVGILLSLVLFASSVAFLMYTKQSDMRYDLQQDLAVFISAKNIKKGDMLSAEDIKLTYLPKSYTGPTAITAEDILGKYALVEIIPNELIRIEKLSLVQPVEGKSVTDIAEVKDEKEDVVQLGSDTISVSLELFKNIDYSLKSGDFIDIVSVLPEKNGNKDYEFSARYVALHVQINSINLPITIQADEKSRRRVVPPPTSVVLSMKPQEIKNFLNVYYTVQNINTQRVYNEQNRGHLWMVKCSKNSDEKLESYKKTLMVDAKKVHKKRKYTPSKRVSISYEK